jgi:hypothetical protein
MKVITIEKKAFRELKQMFIESQETVKAQASMLLQSKIGLLDPKQVAELTGYDEKTIRSKKEDIGYSTMGKNIKFRMEDVNAWINKGYRPPRHRKYS